MILDNIPNISAEDNGVLRFWRNLGSLLTHKDETFGGGVRTKEYEKRLGELDRLIVPFKGGVDKGCSSGKITETSDLLKFLDNKYKRDQQSC